MTLGLNTRMATDVGDFLPIIKFNAEAGRLFQIERAPDATGKWVSEEIELRPPVLLVFDFGCIEVGWMLFAAGQPPSRTLVPLGERMPEQPTPEHRDGFRMRVWNPNIGVREFASNSKMLNGAVSDVHDIFEKAPEAIDGMLPVVKYSGAMAVKGKMRTSYRPMFEIVKWVERASDFGPRLVPPPVASFADAGRLQAEAAANAAARPLRHAPPPPVRTSAPSAAPYVAPSAGASSGDDWGGESGVTPAQPWGRDQSLDDEIPF